ncbi:hypothetical protein [Marseilla massiliensis]|uniref:Uncharacterized protein n=1 Tax=Marseilla massiliensis TaxID=1841864 RepID=A0A938WTI9_9BACT|nr:hypothetical protein [Marseilla massiliensis]MBM6673792.1 hypothetical protein [Marseilla massiliensis]
MFIDNFDVIDSDDMATPDFTTDDMGLVEEFPLNLSGDDAFESFKITDDDMSFMETDMKMYQDDSLFPSEKSDFLMMGQPASGNFGSNSDNLSFMGRDTLSPNVHSEGYIPDGRIELTSTIGDVPKTFKLYTKDGHSYVLDHGCYYKIDGPGTVTINGIKYDKI